MVLPFSALMVLAMSAARSSMSCAARSRMRIRSCAGVRRQVTAPGSAAVMAAATSSPPALGTAPTTDPSYGEVMSSTRPDAAAHHSPPINI
jgi:hypothetical protein